MNKILTPFEQAAENVRKFAESADMMQSMADLKKLLDDVKKLSEAEQESVHTIVELAIINLSKHLDKTGEKWN